MSDNVGERREGRAACQVPDVRVDFDVETPMRDGTILRSDIYRPGGTDRVPAILLRTPYDKRIYHSSHMGFDARMATAAGYAVVVQDVRGRFASDGEFLIIPTQAVEGPDGYDTIEWLAQRSWCSGAIGMIGASYASLAQFMAAIEQPPHLRAIVPEKTGTTARGAVHLDSTMISWTALQALDWVQKAMLRQEAGEKELAIVNEALKHPEVMARYLPLNDMPLRKIGSLPTFQQMIDLLLDQNNLDIAAIEVPALIVSGWYDMCTTETARIYESLRKRQGLKAGSDETNIVFGPWEHGSCGAGLGELSFGPFAHARFAEIPQLYLNFYDRHLKGDSSKPIVGAKYFVMGSNTWKTSSAWPPLHEPKRMFLFSLGSANGADGDGRLVATPPSDEAKPDHYRYDPLDPTPSIGGRYFEFGGSRAGPFDQRRVEQRKDVLVYTGDTLKSSIEIGGPVKLHLFLSCSAPDTDLVVKLCDVREDGVSYNVLDEFYRCRWREGYGKNVRFELGKVYEFSLDVGPIAHCFMAGHRMRFQITSSAFPHFDRNMNTGNPIGTDAKGVIADVTIYHDAKRPSSVVLPFVAS